MGLHLSADGVETIRATMRLVLGIYMFTAYPAVLKSMVASVWSMSFPTLLLAIELGMLSWKNHDATDGWNYPLVSLELVEASRLCSRQDTGTLFFSQG